AGYFVPRHPDDWSCSTCAAGRSKGAGPVRRRRRSIARRNGDGDNPDELAEPAMPPPPQLAALYGPGDEPTPAGDRGALKNLHTTWVYCRELQSERPESEQPGPSAQQPALGGVAAGLGIDVPAAVPRARLRDARAVLLAAASVYQDKLGEMVSHIKTTDLLRGVDEVDLRSAAADMAHPLVKTPPKAVRAHVRTHFSAADECFDNADGAWVAQLLRVGTDGDGAYWKANGRMLRETTYAKRALTTARFVILLVMGSQRSRHGEIDEAAIRSLGADDVHAFLCLGLKCGRGYEDSARDLLKHALLALCITTAAADATTTTVNGNDDDDDPAEAELGAMPPASHAARLGESQAPAADAGGYARDRDRPRLRSANRRRPAQACCRGSRRRAYVVRACRPRHDIARGCCVVPICGTPLPNRKGMSQAWRQVL
ncbi:MAG: hypothetical protein VXX04_05680, partial [Actinomycetota bacterium]|nr:hypothetical protein [Actinomycetota bacterium]